MEYRSLGNTGLQLSLIGLGGSGYGGLYGEYDEEEAARTLRYQSHLQVLKIIYNYNNLYNYIIIYNYIETVWISMQIGYTKRNKLY